MKLEKIGKVDEVMSKRGKMSKRKGGNYERLVAKRFSNKYGVELKRTPQSGGFAKKSEKTDDFRGDITIVDNTQMLNLHIECKNHKTLSIPKWIRQMEEDSPVDRVPMLVFHIHNSSKDYVCLSLDDFFKLVEKEKIVGKRVFKK